MSFLLFCLLAFAGDDDLGDLADRRLVLDELGETLGEPVAAAPL
jgi:hypothetical protein